VKWASSISVDSSLPEALEETTRQLKERLGDAVEPHIALVFVSPHHRARFSHIASGLQQQMPHTVIVGSSGAGVIGAGREVEASPALSITVGHLPGVKITARHISSHSLPSPDAPPDAWHEMAGVAPEDVPQFLMLIDPFSLSAAELIRGVDFAFPSSVTIGGLASGGFGPGANALFCNGHVFTEGAVGVAFSGNIILDTVVAQGCRPLGEPMRITRAEANFLLEIDGEPPLRVLEQLYENLPEQDRALMQRNLFMGLAMDPLEDDLRQGGFLIRNLLGADTERGALAIGSPIHEGQLVQFHVRDSQTSREDLSACLEGYMDQAGGPPAAGAVLFSCVGRGQGLYGRPNHDSDLFGRLMGDVPLGGFFCDGELGPVAGSTYLHTYTSSFAIFRPRTTS
jgi:small ligand-binding sensory domain FIST